MRFLLCFSASFLFVPFTHAQFITVLNVPPDPNIGDNGSIGSNTKLNLFDGGRIGESFEAGVPFGFSMNVEINISGGMVGDGFDANGGSTVNVSAGMIGRSFRANGGSTVNISGGVVGDAFRANGGSTVNISGGSVGHGFSSFFSEVNISGGSIGRSGEALEGSTVNISGGSTGVEFNAYDRSTVNVSGGYLGGSFNAFPGSTTNISGGRVGQNFRAIDTAVVNVTGGVVEDGFTSSGDRTLVVLSGGSVGDNFRTGGTFRVYGGEYRLNGQPIPGLSTLGDTMNLTLPELSVFSGTLADGTPFVFSQFESDSIDRGVLTLEVTALPDIIDAPLVLPGDSAPLGIRDGQHLRIEQGGRLGDHFNAGMGSTVTMTGGEVGYNFEALGATVTISGGLIGDHFDAFGGSTVNISGGSVGRDFNAFRDSIVNISGGEIGNGLDANRGSVVNISGGSFGSIDADQDSQVNLFGIRFVVDGVDIQETLEPYMPFTINDRGVPFVALLSDGSEFSLNLADTEFDPRATLTVSLVRPGDTNADGLVNVDDLNDVRNAFGSIGPNDGTLTGDAVPWNGIVDIDDLNAVRNNFGAGVQQAVPEPSFTAMALIGIGMFPLLGGGRRR